MALAERFVCAADEVWRLQRGSEADCVFFQRMVNGGERIVDKGTRQGVWVCSPGGVLLAAVNTRDVERVLAVMEQGLEAWERLPEAQRRLPADIELAPRHRWEDSLPEGGLVLERIGRDLSPEGLDGPRSDRWNRDTVWCSAEEVAGWVPVDASPGDTFGLPALAGRLARFHLVDNVRGQTLPFAPEELRDARLTAEVLERDGPRLVLRLTGATRAESDGDWLLGDGSWRPPVGFPHGIETTLLGRATFDADAGAFRDLELVAVGRRWGRTGNNARGPQLEPSLVGFHLALAPPGLRVAPTFVEFYDVGWVSRPEVPTWFASPAECGLPGG